MRPFTSRDVMVIASAAFAVKLVFLLLVANTYDYDEFVILLLARDFADGAWPYHSFMFFHPPGILVLYRLIEPITTFWWPLGRLLPLLADVGTSLLVYRIGAWIFGRRAGIAAAIIYVLSPLTLIASVRIGQDPIITFFGVLGLYFLMKDPGRRSAIAAGVCLALAVWVKYPAIYFLPVYVAVLFWVRRGRAGEAPQEKGGRMQLAPPRDRILCTGLLLASAVAAFVLLMVPFHADWRALYDQTITFQRTRWLMPLDQRIATTALFWLGMNPLALIALFVRPRISWVTFAFLVGGLFVFTSQVYYHYFVPVVPFAAMLGGAWIASLDTGTIPALWEAIRRKFVPVVFGLAAVIVLGWALILNTGGSSPLYVTAAHLDSIALTTILIDERSASNRAVLADRYEYAYLAKRPALSHYFWNVGPLVDARYLERRVSRAGLVVLSYGASSGYPPGFLEYLNARYPRLLTPANTIWLVHPLPERNRMHSG